MRRIFRALILLAVGLPLSGCVVGDGIAHVVKKTRDQFRSDDQSSQATAPSESQRAEAPRDENPPPPPAAAPDRGSVTVESLPPPK